MKKNSVMILCRVVDNFGDIGVVYRLAKSLSRKRAGISLLIAVYGIGTFKKLCPKIDADKKIQKIDFGESEWTVLDWRLTRAEFMESGILIPALILECFQCGRPEFLEEILFSDGFRRETQIVNIDYLTAEGYAEEFHLLKSGTRKKEIHKINFLPGFTERTGGLIDSKSAANAEKLDGDFFNILVFTYEQDFSPFLEAVLQFQKKFKKARIFLAQGCGRKPFLESLAGFSEKGAEKIEVVELGFLPQERWDSLLAAMDFCLVRGEESLSRAALSGIPFLWHAYRQEENYQLVKVEALLVRMERHFPEGEFKKIRGLWIGLNDSETEKIGMKLFFDVLESAFLERISHGFREFAQSLSGNDLAENLLEYADSLPF